MISIFRSYHPAAIFMLLLYAVLLRVVAFIAPLPFHVPEAANYLSQLCYNIISFFAGSNAMAFHAVAFVLVFAQAFYFNYQINSHHILQKPSYLPAMSYLLVSSLFNEFVLLTPALIANTFLLFAVSKILSGYKKEKALAIVFDAGLLVSIASLCFFPYVIFFLFIAASIAVLRPFSLREYVLAALGLIVPYYFIGVYFFWNEHLDVFWQTIRISQLSFPVQQIAHGARELVIGFTLLFVVVWSLFFIQSNIFRMVVQVRSYIMVFILLFICGVLTLLVQFNGEFYHFIWMALPVGLAFAIFFTEFHRRLVAELLHFFLILAVLFFQYFFLIK